MIDIAIVAGAIAIGSILARVVERLVVDKLRREPVAPKAFNGDIDKCVDKLEGVVEKLVVVADRLERSTRS